MAAVAAIKKKPIKRAVRDLYRRVGGVPLPCGPQNLVHFLQSREVSGPLRTRDPMFAHVFRDLDIVRSHRGHPAPVIQILYDAKCIKYVTLSRGGLIKVWKVRDGRLLGVYRSDVEDICDIALSRDDRFLIGVSDCGIALWDFKTRELLATINHIESVSRIFFMTKPEREVKHFVFVTKEAVVKFFEYRDLGARRGVKLHYPRTIPVGFPEASAAELKGMTAVTQLSPCGTYLFVGLRRVRVFAVDPVTGPQIILNVEMYKDTFVTIMSWSNAGDRFLTTTSTETTTNNEAASNVVSTNNETIELWNYSTNGFYFDRKPLDLSRFKRENNRPEVHTGQKWGASALCWDAFDQYFLTANKLGVILVWDPDTCRVIREAFAEERIEYLIAHPIEKGIIVSADVDSIIIFWDMLRLDYNDDTPTAIVSFTNKIGRVPNTFTSMVWSNDGTVFLVADVECCVTTYTRLVKVNGVPINAEEEIFMPKELFFHTEFQPLVRDSDGRLLDKEARLPPHLVPPPFLVDMEGNPYPPALQRLVPGREHCSDAELTPGVDVLYGIYKNTNNWSLEVREDLEWMLAKYWEGNEFILV